MSKNKYGGYTWKIELENLFYIFIHESNTSTFIVECKEWGWIGYNTHLTYTSTASLLDCIAEAFNRIYEVAQKKGKAWSFHQHNQMIAKVFRLLENGKSLEVEDAFGFSNTKRWSDLLIKHYPNEDKQYLSAIVNKLYLPDRIDYNKFINNRMLVAASWQAFEKKDNAFEFYMDPVKSTTDKAGTESLKKVYLSFVPRILGQDLFISAYPDVYVWYSNQNDKDGTLLLGRFHPSVSKVQPTSLDDKSSHIEIYRSLIDKFKQQGNRLECS